MFNTKMSSPSKKFRVIYKLRRGIYLDFLGEDVEPSHIPQPKQKVLIDGKGYWIESHVYEPESNDLIIVCNYHETPSYLVG